MGRKEIITCDRCGKVIREGQLYSVKLAFVKFIDYIALLFHASVLERYLGRDVEEYYLCKDCYKYVKEQLNKLLFKEVKP